MTYALNDDTWLRGLMWLLGYGALSILLLAVTLLLDERDETRRRAADR